MARLHDAFYARGTWSAGWRAHFWLAIWRCVWLALGARQDDLLRAARACGELDDDESEAHDG